MIAGCSSQTAGQKAQVEAKEKTNAADMMLRGEKHIADGEAEIARGKTIKEQGDTVEGDRQIAEGKALKSLGEEELAQGKKINDKN